MATEPLPSKAAPDPELGTAQATGNRKPKPASDATKEDIVHGVRIFTFPKIIFIWPTFVAALICGIGMVTIRNNTSDPKRVALYGYEKVVEAKGAPGAADAGTDQATVPADESLQVYAIPRRFNSPQNLFALFFLMVFAFNMVVLSLDFPRFTLVGGILLIIAVLAILGWLSAAFGLAIIQPLIRALEGVFVVADAEFYFILALILAISFALIWVTRWLDYWEVRPNELLHHHGPLSDLGRYPTTNLKFDKEIPDVLEYLILGAGRLVMHVPSENRAFVLDSVLWIDDKERRLKSLMSRMEVRITTDQEAAG
jgi:hypothetical protein